MSRFCVCFILDEEGKKKAKKLQTEKEGTGLESVCRTVIWSVRKDAAKKDLSSAAEESKEE